MTDIAKRRHQAESLKKPAPTGDIKLEVAIRVYAELIGQAVRGNRLSDPMMPNLANTAINSAQAFLQVWQGTEGEQ
jgi:hypothetical protein